MASAATSLTGIIYLKLRDRDCKLRAKRDENGNICIDFTFLDKVSIRDYPDTSIKLNKDEALRLIHQMLGEIVAKE